jgi:hypothetical protein
MVFQILGLLVSKPSLLWITANKASQTKSHLHMNVCVCECNDVFFQNFCTKQMFFSETYKFNNVSWVKFISMTFLTKIYRFLTITHQLLNDTTKCVIFFDFQQLQNFCMHTSKRHLQTVGRCHTTLLNTHIYRNYLHQIQTNLGYLFHSRPAWTKVVMSTTNSRTMKTYTVNVLWVFSARRITQMFSDSTIICPRVMAVNW